MVFEEVVDGADKGGDVFEAEEAGVEVGGFEAANHTAAVVRIVDHADAEVDVFLGGAGDKFTEVHFIEEVGGGIVVEAVAGHGDDGLAEGEEVDGGVVAAEGVSIEGEVRRFELLHVVGEIEVGEDLDVVFAENIADGALKGEVAVGEAGTAREEAEDDGGLGAVLDFLEAQEVFVVDLLGAPGAVDENGALGESGIAELVIERDRGLGATGDEDEAFGVMFKGAFGVFSFLSAHPVVDFCAKGADGVTVVADLDGGDAHIGEEDTLNAHADVGEVGHFEVVVLNGGEVVAVGGGVEMADFGEDAVVGLFIFVTEFDEDEVVFFGKGLEERELGSVHALAGEPHAGQHRDAAFLGLVLDFGLAERGLLDEAIDALFDEVVFFVVDVGRAEIDVVGESVDAGEAVVFVVDVGAKVLEGFGIGTTDAVAFAVTIIPEGRKGGIGIKEDFPVEGDAVVDGIQDEEFGEVALLAQEDVDKGVGIAELAHGDDVANGAVEGDHLRGVGIGEGKILHRHEVKEVHDEAVEGLFFCRGQGVVGDLLEVKDDLHELLRHGVEV